MTKYRIQSCSDTNCLFFMPSGMGLKSYVPYVDNLNFNL